MGNPGQRSLMIALALLVLSARPAVATDFQVLGATNGLNGFRDVCRPGSYLVGLRARTGKWMDKVGIVCKKLNADGSMGPRDVGYGSHGGNGGAEIENVCSDGKLIKGMYFFLAANKGLVTAIVFSCSSASNTGPGLYDPSNPISFGNRDMNNDSGKSRDQFCPDGEAAIGLAGSFSTYVNAIGLICGPQVKPAAMCASGYVWRDSFDGDITCVKPDDRWKLANGQCRNGYVFLQQPPREKVCVTPAQRDAAAKNAASAAKQAAANRLLSSDARDFVGTWHIKTTDKLEFDLQIWVVNVHYSGSYSYGAVTGGFAGNVKRRDSNGGTSVRLDFAKSKSANDKGDSGFFEVYTDNRLVGKIVVKEPGSAPKYLTWYGTRLSREAKAGEAKTTTPATVDPQEAADRDPRDKTPLQCQQAWVRNQQRCDGRFNGINRPQCYVQFQQILGACVGLATQQDDGAAPAGDAAEAPQPQPMPEAGDRPDFTGTWDMHNSRGTHFILTLNVHGRRVAGTFFTPGRPKNGGTLSGRITHDGTMSYTFEQPRLGFRGKGRMMISQDAIEGTFSVDNSTEPYSWSGVRTAGGGR